MTAQVCTVRKQTEAAGHRGATHLATVAQVIVGRDEAQDVLQDLLRQVIDGGHGWGLSGGWEVLRSCRHSLPQHPRHLPAQVHDTPTLARRSPSPSF